MKVTVDLSGHPAGPFVSRMIAPLHIFALISLYVAQNAAWPQDPSAKVHLKYRE